MIISFPVYITKSIPKHLVPLIIRATERHFVVYRLDKFLTKQRQLVNSINIDQALFRMIKNYKLLEAETLHEQRDPNDRRKFETINPRVIDQTIEFIEKQKQEFEDKIEQVRRELKKEERKPVNQKDEDKIEELQSKIHNLEKEIKDLAKEESDLVKAKKEIEQKQKTTKIENFEVPSNIDINPITISIRTNSGHIILGVKGFPVLFQSDKLATLFFSGDIKAVQDFSKYIPKLITRKIMRFVNKLKYRFLKLVTFGTYEKVSTGDVIGDVLFSLNPSDTVVVFDKNDIQDFYTTPKYVRRLQRLHWKNIVVLDDDNKILYFCSEENKGYCSNIHMRYLANTYKSNEVYNSLEEAVASSKSLFRVKRVRFDKMMIENSNLLEQEGATKSIDKNQLKTAFIKAYKMKSAKPLQNLLPDNLKTIKDFNTLDKLIYKTIPKIANLYKSNVEKTKKIITNSTLDLELPKKETLIDGFSRLAVLMSITKDGIDKKKLNKRIAITVQKLYDIDNNPDKNVNFIYLMEMIVSIVTITVIGITVYNISSIVAYIVSFVLSPWFLTFLLLVIVMILILGVTSK